MISHFVRKNAKFGFLPFLGELFGPDNIDGLTKTEQNADMSAIKSETGWNRIKQMFEVDDMGNISRELNSVFQTACMSLFMGSLYGGVMSSKGTYLDFITKNQATTFKTPLEAKRRLQDAVTISFGKGAFKWGWRVTLFSTTFMGLTTTIQVYRGKCGIAEYASAGALTGAMYKFNGGPKAWLVGGSLGAFLGLLCGGATLGLLKVAGISMEEARFWQYEWRRSRSEMINKGRSNHLESENFAVIKLHNDEVGEAGKNIENLEKGKRSPIATILVWMAKNILF